MKHINSDRELDLQLFAILLRPSALSGFIGVVGAVTIVAYIAVSNVYNGSFSLANGTTASIGHKLDSNQFISNLPLLTFWLLVGVVVYIFALNIVTAVRNAAELEAEFSHYTNLSRKKLLLASFQKLVIRAFVIAIWVPYILYFFHTIVPYSLALSVAGTSQTSLQRGMLHFVVAVAILAISSHLHTVLIRLLLLKPRVFSSAIY